MEVRFIHGTSFNISEVFVDEEQPHLIYYAKVSKVNRFGFFEVTIADCDKKLKRHLMDCYDLQGVCLAGQIMGLVCKGPESYMLTMRGDFEEVYFVRRSTSDGYEYVARTRTNSPYTEDITKAWFTFDKEQAERFASKLTLKELTVYESVSAEDAIQLDTYVEG